MVVAADDQGHETATNGETLWGKFDPQLRLEFGYLSEHKLAQTAKTLIFAFYGRHPAYSYFSGVSDGGHEALVLAQRFPEDFDGILAGAPGNNWAALDGHVRAWAPREPDGRRASRSSPPKNAGARTCGDGRLRQSARRDRGPSRLRLRPRRP